MREALRRPGAAGDTEAPQSADAGDGDAGAGTQQEAARAQRAHKRRDAAADAEAAAFNERHAAEVAEFNQLTQNACLGKDGKLDPAAVKDWQREHNVAPDGKVGPKTVAAAGGKDAQDGKADQQLASASAAPRPKARGPIEEMSTRSRSSPTSIRRRSKLPTSSRSIRRVAATRRHCSTTSTAPAKNTITTPKLTPKRS